MPRLAWPSWRWMTLSGTPFARHLDRVRVTELMWGKATAYAGGDGEVTEGGAGSGWRPGPGGWRAVGETQEGPCGHLDTPMDPPRALPLAPATHADLAALPALAAADKHPAGRSVEIALGEG